MSVLSTGKPLIWIAKLDKFDNIGEWTQVDVPKDGTTNLATSEGDVTKYLEEGGDPIDVDQKACSYTFTFDLFVKKGFKKPITDKNGVIVDNYAVRLAPKDRECAGFIMYKAQVTNISSYSTADGMIAQYKFEGLQTDDHDNIWDYWVEATHLYTNKNFVDVPATAPQGSESITATVTCSDLETGETVTASDDADWISTSVSDGTVTITATANTGKRREGWVTLESSEGKFTEIRVNQAAGASA